MLPHYHINIFWSAEDEAWIADVPDLRSCSAHGDTPAAALAEAEVAIAAWLDTARDNDLAAPEPRYRPAIYALRSAA
jgi:predicted RNase H-like HicB family nuclease